MPTSKPTGDLSKIWADTAPGPDILYPGDAKYTAGWLTEIPPHSTFNYIQNIMTHYIAYQNEQGISAWDVLIEYPIDGMVKGTDGNTYVSKLVQTGNNPVGDGGTNWRAFAGVDGKFYYPEQNAGIDITVNGVTRIIGGAGVNYNNSVLTIGDGVITAGVGGNTQFNINSTVAKLLSPSGNNILEANDSEVNVTASSGNITIATPNGDILNEMFVGHRFRVNREGEEMIVINDVQARMTHPTSANIRGDNGVTNSTIVASPNGCSLFGNTNILMQVGTNIIMQGNSSRMIMTWEGATRLEPTNAGITVTGDVLASGICGASDKRLKENVKSLDPWASLDIISKLRPVEFEWNEGAKRILGSPDGIQRGLIAQEVEDVIPDVVKEVPSKLLGTHKVLSHGSDTALMMSAIQALNHKMEVLSDENKQLNARVRQLEKKLSD